MNFFKRRLVPYGFLLAVAIISIWIFYPSPFKFTTGIDAIFHLNRIREIDHALANHNSISMLYSFDSFANVGTAVQQFYPNKMLIVFGWLYLITNNFIVSIFFGLIFYSFVGLIVSYECWLAYNDNRKQALVFSLVFNLSIYHGLQLLWSFDLGQWLAMLWLPIIFLGAHEILEKNRYRGSLIVAVGLLLISATHILSAVLSAVILFAIWLGYVFFDRKQIISKTLKCILAFFLIIIGNLQFIIYYHQLGSFIEQPYKFLLEEFTVDYNQLVLISTNNSMHQSSLGLFFIFVIVFYLLNFRKATKRTHVLMTILVIITIITSNYIPWALFNKTPISIIQFPNRFYALATLFVAIIFTEMWATITENQKASKQKRTYIYLIMAILFMQFGSELVTRVHVESKSETIKNEEQNSSAWIIQNRQPEDLFLKKLNSRNVDFNLNMIVHSGNIIDYWPKKSVYFKQSILEQKILSNNNMAYYISNPIQKNNMISFSVHSQYKNRKLDLPILNYKNQYEMYVNGSKIDYTESNRGTIEFVTPSNNVTVTLLPKHLKSNQLLMLLYYFEVLLLLIGIFFTDKINRKFGQYKSL